MRIKSVSILLLLFYSLSIRTQSITAHVEINDKNFEDLVEIISDLYGVKFSYQSDLLDEEILNFYSANNSLSEFLDFICDKKSLEYQLLDEGKTVLIRKKLQPPIITTHEQTIKIKLVDESTNVPIDYAAIQLLNSSRGVYTNENGLAELAIPQQLNTLSIHRIGYLTKELIIDLSQGKEIELTLQSANYNIEEVLVKDRLKAYQYHKLYDAYVIRSEHTSAGTLSGTVSDIKAMAGVNSFEDNNARIKLRGASFDATMIMLDGMQIYNPTHYFGLFSGVNDSYVATATLYKNNLPIEYGGKTGGLLKLDSYDALNLTKTHGDVTINNLTISGKLLLPITSHWAIKLAGRTSYSNITNSNLISLLNKEKEQEILVQNFSLISRNQLVQRIPDFYFNDLNAGVVYEDNNHAIRLNYYQSKDRFKDEFSNTFRSRDRRLITLNTEAFSNIENWKNRTASLLYDGRIAEHLTLENEISFSSFQNNNAINASLSRTTALGERSFSFNNSRDNVITEVSFQSTLSYTTATNDKLKIGLGTIHHNIATDIIENNRSVISTKHKANEYHWYGAFESNSNQPFFYSAGLRSTYYDALQQWYVSPRAQANYAITSSGLIKMAVGRQYQFARELNFENTLGRSTDIWVLAGSMGDLAPRRSDKIMLGTRWYWDRFSVDIESYYSHTTNHVDLALKNLSFGLNDIVPISSGVMNDYRFFVGESFSRGIDISFDYTSSSYSASLAYTLSKTEDSFRGIRAGERFLSQDDRRHQFKSVHLIRLGSLSLNYDFSYASGRVYTDLNKSRSLTSRELLSPADRQSRLPYYMRMDVGIKYGFKIEGLDASVGLDIYNLLDRANVNYLQYIFSIPSNTDLQQDRAISTIIGNESTLIPRTVSLSFGLKF